jgi:hypothetical protein
LQPITRHTSSERCTKPKKKQQKKARKPRLTQPCKNDLLQGILQKLKMDKKRTVRKIDIYHILAQKYANLSKASRETGIRWNTLYRASILQEDDGKRKDAIGEKVKQVVTDFYVRPTVSISLPYHKSAKKKFLNSLHTLHTQMLTLSPPWDSVHLPGKGLRRLSCLSIYHRGSVFV